MSETTDDSLSNVASGFIVGAALGFFIATVLAIWLPPSHIATMEASNGYRLIVDGQQWLVTDTADECSIALEAIEALREARR